MKKIIEQLQQSVNDALPKLSSISEEEFTAKPNPNKWSKKEILGHLVDSAINNTTRFVQAQYDEHLKVDYSGDKWVAITGYQSCNKNSLIPLWKLLNEHICVILENMPADKYENLCESGDPEPRTLKWLAEDYVTHLNHHLAQLMKEGGASSSQ